MALERQYLVEFLDAQGLPVGNIVASGFNVVTSRITGTSVGVATSIATYAGNGQSGLTAGAVVPIPPSVRVTDANGVPVAGSTVTWFHGGGSGTTSTGTVTTTNSNGVSQVGSWSLGTTAGSQYTLFAYSGNLTNQPIRFSYTPVAASAYSTTCSGGTSQTTVPTGAMLSRLSALVHDIYGNPVNGAAVTMSSTDAAGVFGATALVTNSSGVAGTTYTAGTLASVASVLAAISSTTSCRFDMTTTVGAAQSVAITSGNNQIGLANGILANPVQVSIDDGFGNPISSGETLQFVVVQGSGAVSRATATPLNSTSSFTWQVGATAGQNAVEISLQNRSNSTVTAFASGTNPVADTLVFLSGAGQSATVAQPVTTPIRWGVTGSGSSCSGQVVTLTITGDGALNSTTTVSSTSGLVSIAATAGTVSSRYTIVATATGLVGSPSTVTFDAVAASAASLFIAVQPEANPQPGVAWNTQPVVYSGDSYGNPVSLNTRIGIVLVGGDGTLDSSISMFAVASGATATFSGVSYTQVTQSQFTVAFRCNSLSTVTATTQFAKPPFASKLGFTTQPVGGVTGQTIGTVVVAVQDSTGNTVTTATNAVTLAIGTNPAGGTISGTLTVSAVNGIATFSNVAITGVGTGYTVTASATNLTGATSAAFNVTAANTSHPNEPAGMTQLIDSSLAGLTLNATIQSQGGGQSVPVGQMGLASETGAGNCKVQTISDQAWRNSFLAALPACPNGYDRIHVCQFGATDGSGYNIAAGEKGRYIFTPGANAKSVYIDMYVLIGSNWYGQSGSGDFKKVYMRTSNEGPYIQSFKGATTATIRLSAYVGANTTGIVGATDTSITEAVDFNNMQVMQKNTWYRVELLFVTESAANAGNAHMTCWIDGVKKFQITACDLSASAGNLTWVPSEILHYWGGGGTTAVPASTGPMLIATGDHLYISVSNSRVAVP